MTRLLLVRHARPVADFSRATDPGLDDVGRAQAEALAATLGVDPAVTLLTSPLRRARETAAPLAARWSCEPRVAAAFGEIPAPDGSLAERGEWLRGLLPMRWSEVEPRLRAWRSALLDAVAGLPGDSVVVSHYVAINTVVGAATGDDRIVSCAPGHASVTEVEVTGGALRLTSPPSS